MRMAMSGYDQEDETYPVVAVILQVSPDQVIHVIKQDTFGKTLMSGQHIRNPKSPLSQIITACQIKS